MQNPDDDSSEAEVFDSYWITVPQTTPPTYRYFLRTQDTVNYNNAYVETKKITPMQDAPEMGWWKKLLQFLRTLCAIV